jgi:hypothetical protein
MNKATIVLCTLVLFSSVAQGKTFMCKDDEGNTMFSDSACGTVERKEIKDMSGPSAATLEKRAVDGCLAYLKKQKPYLNNGTAQVENYQFKWVAVKGVGLRRMLTLMVSNSGKPEKSEESKEAEPPPQPSSPPQSFECLLLGDGVSINTYQYELVPIPE